MYFADKYSEIPLGIVNKRLTGCGLSSFALENSDKVVLVVPNISMIQNKVAQYPNTRRTEKIFGFYGGVDTLELLDYLDNTVTPKIMVTYDSFPKIKQYIPKDFHIVVDEFSDLLDAYGYRDKAINNLLNVVFEYPKLSFISATPIKDEYLPTQLRQLQYTELEWDNLTPVQVVPCNTTKPLTAVLNIIKKYKSGLVEVNGHKSEVAYFYVNSVLMIRDIIKKAELLDSEVRIICANTPENESKLELFDIKTTIDPEKPFNFLTSSNFKGSDIYSDNGIAYVVSNNQNKHTLLTIDTDIYQIAGRIRNLNNPFRNLVYHIFNENPLKLSQDEFNNILNRKIKTTNQVISAYNKVDSLEKESMFSTISLTTNSNENYLLVSGDNFIFDELKLAQERRIYECVIKVYQSGLSVINSYLENGFEVVEDTMKSNKINFLTGNNFKFVCRLVCEDKCNKSQVFKQYPLIQEGYEKLGIKRLKALGYDSGKIKNELRNIDSAENINEEILKVFESNQFYSSKDVKVMLTNLYNNLGIAKKAKANDLECVYKIKSIRRLINNKQVRGYEIP